MRTSKQPAVPSSARRVSSATSAAAPGPSPFLQSVRSSHRGVSAPLARLSLHPTPAHALAVQRRCAACEDEELQRKTQDPQNDHTAASGLDSVAATLRQGGHALDPAARAFFEPRFGADFSAVRIHTGSQAAASARAINALAYTVGNNVVFNTGQYAPHHDAGKRLMAHELAHVLQQGGSVRRTGAEGAPAPTIQRQPDPDAVAAAGTECDINESNPTLWFDFDSTHLRSDAMVDSTVHLASLIGRVRRHFASAGGLGHVELRGYASAEGDGAHNLDLSRRRAEQTRSLLEAAGIPGSQISTVGLGESTSMPGRQWNRRVEICLTPPVQDIEMDPEEVTADVMDCAHPPAAVSTLEQYSFLVACIERAMPSIGPRDMLSLLRQAYYGGGHFNEVIPCGTSAGTTALSTLRSRHATLYRTLMASKVVAHVDLGHVFTGLEAMVCPSSTVEIEVPGPNPVVAMPNEEFATWGGDLGSAAAQRTHDEADRGLRRGWAHYFGTAGSMASYEDLRGDIDSFAVRAGLAGSCTGSRMTTLPALTTPISGLLLGYYGAGPAVTAADRFRCMVEALGGTIVGGRITNKSTLVSAMSPRVRSFAEIFYLSLVTVPLFAIGPLEAILLLRYAREASGLFMDWLESEL